MIFPAVNDPSLARTTSRVNPSVVGTAGIIGVQPCGGVFEVEEK